MSIKIFTKKKKQRMENEHVKHNANLFVAQYGSLYDTARKKQKAKRLRYCNAYVQHFDKYIVLISYSTVVAFIDTERNEMFDILRLVYGYTATSAQHISKFRQDYANSLTITSRYKAV